MAAVEEHTPTKIAEGREAEMFAWEEGKILRLFRPDYPIAAREHQVRSLQAAAEAGVRVPQIFGTTEVNGRAGIVMERIEGTDLLTLIGRRPWKVWWVGGVAGRTQAGINAKQAPDSLPAIKDAYERRIRSEASIQAEYAKAALAALAELPDGDRLIHGDFHPGNIMMQDGEPVVIDWSNATRGDPDADLARTMLMMKLGDPPPGAPLVVRAGARFARSILGDAHMRAYRRVRKPDMAALQRWELPMAVARITEGIESERAKLNRLIEAHLRKR